MNPKKIADEFDKTLRKSLSRIDASTVRATIYLRRENGKVDICIGIPESESDNAGFDELIEEVIFNISGN